MLYKPHGLYGRRMLRKSTSVIVAEFCLFMAIALELLILLPSISKHIFSIEILPPELQLWIIGPGMCAAGFLGLYALVSMWSGENSLRVMLRLFFVQCVLSGSIALAAVTLEYWWRF